MNPSIHGTIALTVLAWLPFTQGQEAVVHHEKRAGDGIAETIHARDLLIEGAGWVESRGERKKRRTQWMHELGLDVAFTYDSLALGALNDDGGWGSSSGDATLNVRWQINSDTSKSPLSLNVRVRDREAYSDLAPSELKHETGALWGYVDGFTDAGFQVPEVYLEDKFFDQRLTLRYGSMTIDDLLDGHELRSAKRSFLNQAFSSSPAVAFPGSDLGFVARWESRSGWDVTLGISNLASSNLDESAKWRFESDALFQAVQLGYDFNGLGGRKARAQLLGWNADALPEFGLESGSGASLTLEQELAGRARSFVRYAWSDGEAAATDHFVAAGIALDLRKSDRLGVSMAGGSSSKKADTREGVVEVFYRRQITPFLIITPDLQFVAGDGIGRDADWLVIGGLRVGFTF